MNLTHHTLRSYDERLKQLMSDLLEMGSLVRSMIHAASRSLTERDTALAEQAIAADKQINALEHAIEEEVTIILALQNPLAIDLRFVTSALKISAMLERGGDLAKNTIKRSLKLEYAPPPVLDKLSQMTETVVAMLDAALTAFKEQDQEAAAAVWRRDDEVDDLYHEIFTQMQQEMRSNPANAESCTQIVFVAKNFERLADYTTSIAKTVYYVISGKRVNKSVLNA